MYSCIVLYNEHIKPWLLKHSRTMIKQQASVLFLGVSLFTSSCSFTSFSFLPVGVPLRKKDVHVRLSSLGRAWAGLGLGIWEGLDYSQLFGVYAGIMFYSFTLFTKVARAFKTAKDVLWQELVRLDSASWGFSLHFQQDLESFLEEQIHLVRL